MFDRSQLEITARHLMKIERETVGYHHGQIDVHCQWTIDRDGGQFEWFTADSHH